MFRVITIIVLAVFLPMQLFAADFSDLKFNTDDFNYKSGTQTDFFVPRGPDKQKEQPDQKLTGKILAEPPKNADTENSGTNWWLWGGLAAVTIGAAAIFAGGGGGSASPIAGGGSDTGGTGSGGTTAVTGSW